MTNEFKKLQKINESEIELINVIGQGAFGEVFKGKLRTDKTSEITVAIKVNKTFFDLYDFLNIILFILFIIKKLRSNAGPNEKLDLIKEAISLNSFNHANLINFYGVLVNENNEPTYIILEYMNMGDLLTFLRKSRSSKVRLKH